MEPGITWYAQSAVRLDLADLHVYIDPYHIPEGQPPADLILISHQHADHLSPVDLDRIRQATSVVVASAPAAGQIPGEIRVLAPGDTMAFGPIHISAVPAYNVGKFRSPGVPFHPRSEAHVGFVIEADDLTFYFAADTDVIPEMEEIGPVDYAFLPIGGRFVMTPEEAADAARLVRPSVAIPVHYGGAAGTEDDARRFADLVPDQVRVWIMTPAGAR